MKSLTIGTRFRAGFLSLFAVTLIQGIATLFAIQRENPMTVRELVNQLDARRAPVLQLTLARHRRHGCGVPDGARSRPRASATFKNEI